ncbi:hypothetical protein [Ensifer sp. ZNC0028]|uniref:hypothetical protein n=1 Tax=Ensifer sp. ZNC0028 TaxID=1339236 RepID=UPI0012DFFD0B|nr:hypothetical protein [Ensifer sp. ZNC0028]
MHTPHIALSFQHINGQFCRAVNLMGWTLGDGDTILLMMSGRDLVAERFDAVGVQVSN